MLAMKVLSLVTYYNGTPHFAKKGKEKTLQSRKRLQRLFLLIQLCSDSILLWYCQNNLKAAVFAFGYHGFSVMTVYDLLHNQ